MKFVWWLVALFGGTIAAGLIWIALASYIYCAITFQPDAFAWPYTQWLEMAPGWRANQLMTLSVAGSGLGAAGLVGASCHLIYRYVRHRQRHLSPRRRGGDRSAARGVTDNHGHARWADRQDIARRFGPQGCLVGARERRGELMHDPTKKGPTHSLVFSGPDGGKSTSAIARLWNWQGPRIVFDPSIEIGPVMTEALQEAGCNVFTVGFGTDGLDVFDWINPKDPEADPHIHTVVDWIYAESAGKSDMAKDHQFAMWGRQLVTCLAAHMIHSDASADEKTLHTLRAGIITPEDEMQNLLANIYRTSNSKVARDLASSLMGMRAEETFSGIYGNATSATAWLSTKVYADVLSKRRLRTADLLDPNTVVFVQIPMRTLLTTPTVGRAAMGALFNAVIHNDGNGVEDRALFLLDEAWLLGAMKEIKLFYATARKYRGTICGLWQSEGQMESVWGKDDGKLFRDACSWRSYNGIQDGDVAEKLSNDIGEHAVMAYSEGINSGTQRQPTDWFGSRSSGFNINTHEIKRRLIKRDEILRARPDEMFVLARDCPYPVRCFSAPYYQYPKIAGRMANNRFANVG